MQNSDTGWFETPLYADYEVIGTSEDFAEVIGWLYKGGLYETVRAHLLALPDDHDYWSDIIDTIGEGGILKCGIDI